MKKRGNGTRRNSKSRETNGPRKVAVRNYKYYIMNATLYTCWAVLVFFAKEMAAWIEKFLCAVLNGATTAAIQFMAKFLDVVVFVAVLKIIELFFRRKVLDYQTAEE